MSTYNRSEVMSRAWRIFRSYSNLTFSKCLERSWVIEKENKSKISPLILNKILNSLRTINRSRLSSENKPMMSGTVEHFKMLNSRNGRKTMKLPNTNESKQMLDSGILFLHDIIHQRRKDSNHFSNKEYKKKNKFRNRIINMETCVPINIKDYIND